MCSCSTTRWSSTTQSTPSSSRSARRLQLRLLTNDGPLARNAELQGVPTCNLRRLAQELAPAIVPGDFVRVALTRPGKEDGQGVGHLDDGSMVVVNGGDDLVGGPEVMLQITSVVPTNAGRLLFARSTIRVHGRICSRGKRLTAAGRNSSLGAGCSCPARHNERV